jgi:chromate reductase
MADTPFDIAVLIGSLRQGSYTRQIARALATLAPPTLALDIVEIGQLPFYNQDLETESPPASWVAFRERIRRADAVLFATPEYNRSMPAVMKNAIDVGSRPRETNAWNGKPGAVVSVSTGQIGGFGANHHLRQTLVFANVLPLQQPEVYLSNVKTLLDDQGNLTQESTQKFLRAFLGAFEQWIGRLTAPAPDSPNHRD